MALRVGLGTVLLAAIGGAAATVSPDTPAPLTLKVIPSTIEMGTFYGGSPITIEGDAPPGSMVMVVVRGPAKDEVFNKKGRVGPIWINTDKVHVSGAPSLFLRFSSVDVHSILDRRHIDRYQLDEISIVEHLHVRTSRGEPDAEYRELIENSYIDLKKKNGTYRRIATRVQVSRADGGEHYTLFFHWPKTAPPGSYRVEVYACKNNAVIGEANTGLRLVQVGFPAYMAALAYRHPWQYGLVAVVAAVLFGFGIDAIASRLRPTRRVPAPPVPVPAPAEAKSAAAAATHDHLVHH